MKSDVLFQNVSCGSLNIRYNGLIFPNQKVQKGRLAGIWLSYDNSLNSLSDDLSV